MRFTDLFVKRPVLAIVVNLVILIAGLQSIGSLSVREYPRSDIAVVRVSTGTRARTRISSGVSLPRHSSGSSPAPMASTTWNRRAARVSARSPSTCGSTTTPTTP